MRVSTLWLGAAGLLLVPEQAQAQFFDVTNGNASGSGSLAKAVSDANASGAAATIRIDVPSISLGSQFSLANTTQLVGTIGGSQITLSPSSGFNDFFGLGAQPIAFTVGNGITLSTSDANGIFINTIGSTVTINGTVLTSGPSDGVMTAGSARIIVGSSGTIHSTGTAIRELGGIGGNVQINIAPGGSVISDTQPAIIIGTYTIVDNGFLMAPGAYDAVQGSTGTLTGTGIIGNTTINGTFQPGSGTAGTSMTVAGRLAFSTASIYAVNIGPTTASLANVTGTATLDGATVNAIYANGTHVSERYTILTAAGGVSGTFNSLVNTNLPSNFSSSVSYDANDVYLNLSLEYSGLSGLSGNQQNVANVLSRLFNTTGSIPFVLGSLTPAGLTEASGESAVGSQQATFDAMNLFMGLLTDPFVAGRGDGAGAGTTTSGYAEEGYGVSAYAPKDTPRSQSERDAYAAIYRKAPLAQTYDPRWSVWAAGFGGSQTTEGNAALGSNTATSSIAGTVVGADYRISPFTIAGFALAGGGTNFSVAGSGSGHSDLFQAGAFIRHTIGQAYISGSLAYGWQDITTNRTVNVAGIDQLRAQFNANAFSGRLESGYRFVSPWIGGIGITPYAGAQFTTFDLPAYAEQAVVGSNAFALAYNAKDVTDARSELGIRTDKSFAMPGEILTLRGRFAWAHDFDPDRSIAATFQTLPGASFVVNGAVQAHDSALTTASLEMKWLNGWSAAATFEGEFSEVTNSYAGKGVVRYTW